MTAIGTGKKQLRQVDCGVLPATVESVTGGGGGDAMVKGKVRPEAPPNAIANTFPAPGTEPAVNGGAVATPLVSLRTRTNDCPSNDPDATLWPSWANCTTARGNGAPS